MWVLWSTSSFRAQMRGVSVVGEGLATRLFTIAFACRCEIACVYACACVFVCMFARAWVFRAHAREIECVYECCDSRMFQCRVVQVHKAQQRSLLQHPTTQCGTLLAATACSNTLQGNTLQGGNLILLPRANIHQYRQHMHTNTTTLSMRCRASSRWADTSITCIHLNTPDQTNSNWSTLTHAHTRARKRNCTQNCVSVLTHTRTHVATHALMPRQIWPKTLQISTHNTLTPFLTSLYTWC